MVDGVYDVVNSSVDDSVLFNFCSGRGSGARDASGVEGALVF